MKVIPMLCALAAGVLIVAAGASNNARHNALNDTVALLKKPEYKDMTTLYAYAKFTLDGEAGSGLITVTKLTASEAVDCLREKKQEVKELEAEGVIENLEWCEVTFP